MADSTTPAFNKDANSFTVLFATGLCVVLAVCLAGTFNTFKDTIARNERFDKQVNVMIATGLHTKGQAKARQELEELYTKSIRGEVLEVVRGMVEREVRIGGELTKKPFEVVQKVIKTEHELAKIDELRKIEAAKPEGDRKEYVPFYRRIDDAGNDVAYCIPVSGYGLWSTLYGYLALQKDCDTVQGITFYKHAETPGLGGEVDNPAWQAQWRGKKILEGGDLVSIRVKKGRVDPAIAREKNHQVDGLSGATITSNGVTRFIEKDLKTYEPYLKTLRGE